MKTCKVLHIISGLQPGGTEKFLVKLIRAWKREDFEHTVIAFNDGILKEDFARLGISPIILSQKYWHDLRFLSLLFVSVKRLKPDIIHCRNATHVVIYGSIVAKILNLPLVVSVHGHPDFLAGFTQILYDFIRCYKSQFKSFRKLRMLKIPNNFQFTEFIHVKTEKTGPFQGIAIYITPSRYLREALAFPHSVIA